MLVHFGSFGSSWLGRLILVGSFWFVLVGEALGPKYIREVGVYLLKGVIESSKGPCQEVA